MKLLLVILFFCLNACVSKSPVLQEVPCHAFQSGICIKTYAPTETKTIERAQYIIRQMLKNSPEIQRKMTETGFVVEIIGRNQGVTDLPRYRYLKNEKTFDGRNYDEGTRGLGDIYASSVGEENLLCLPGQNYPEENILVHEFAHSILFHMPHELSHEVKHAYSEAKKKNLYAKDIYMMANHDEYWAEASQSWFNATARLDVNDGIHSRLKILKHDSEISRILKLVYGMVEIDHLPGCPY